MGNTLTWARFTTTRGDSMNGRRLTEFPPFREHLNYERRISRSRCRFLIFAVNDDAPVIAKQFLLILDLCVQNGAFMERYFVFLLLFSAAASFTHRYFSTANDKRATTIIHFNSGTCQIATSTTPNVITIEKKSPPPPARKIPNFVHQLIRFAVLTKQFGIFEY